LAVDGWPVTFGTARCGLGGGVQMISACDSSARDAPAERRDDDVGKARTTDATKTRRPTDSRRNV